MINVKGRRRLHPRGIVASARRGIYEKYTRGEFASLRIAENYGVPAMDNATLNGMEKCVEMP